jgi:hypothetical protein
MAKCEAHGFDKGVQKKPPDLDCLDELESFNEVEDSVPFCDWITQSHFMRCMSLAGLHE